VLFLPSPWNVVLVLAAALVDTLETVVMVGWSRRRRASVPPAVGGEAIIGRTGVTLARLDPDRPDALGQVRVDGEIWGARSAEPIDSEVTVVVRAVDGLVLDVESTRRD
jgi:membrane-bound ClpP family serine protease